MSTAEKPQHEHDHGTGIKHHAVPEPRPGSHDDAIPMTREEIQEMLNSSPRQRKRTLGLAAAGTALATTAALTLTGVIDTSPDKITGKPVATSTNSSGEASRQPQGNQSIETPAKPEREPLRGSLCGQIDLKDLLSWTGERAAYAYSPQNATCISSQVGVFDIPLRAHAKWTFPGGRESSSYESMEVAVYDEIQPDGSSAFSQLMTTYTPARTRPMQAGEYEITVIQSRTTDSTLVNIPDSQIDIAFTTQFRNSSQVHPALQEGQIKALPALIPVIINH